MSLVSELYAELTEEAAALAKKEHWVETGTMPPQLNGMLATIYKRIKELEERIESCEGCLP